MRRTSTRAGVSGTAALSELAGAGTGHDGRLHRAVRLGGVRVGDRCDAAAVASLLGARIDLVVVQHLEVARVGVTGLGDGRVLHVLEVVPLDEDAGVHGGGDTVRADVAVVVVQHVHGVGEPDPRVPPV